MKKLVCLCLLACALSVLSFSALADAFFIPNSVRAIEEEAFSDAGNIDCAFIPKSVKSIAPNAFSDRMTTVYGYPGTAAEVYADQTNRTFISIAVPVTEDFFIPVSSVSLSGENGNALVTGGSLRLIAKSEPAAYDQSCFFFFSMNPSVASVTSDGVVTGIGAGKTEILCFSKDGSGAYAHLPVIVQQGVQEISLYIEKDTLLPGEKTRLVATPLPSDAVNTDVVFSSSDASVASVDKNGVVTAKASGSCYIYARSSFNENVKAKCKITVLSNSKTLVMPLRQTGTDGVSANLARIENVKASAFLELENLYARGKISYSVMNSRKTVIANAFSMYAFPWMTKGYQEYWKAENSENGAKDFKPGIVYYGLPYISDYQNRLYNAQKAVSENRYTQAAKGYYLNQNNLLNGKYVGNDCSSMLSISFFGFNSQTANFNTRTFYSSSLFTTLSSSTSLMPGDILVRNGRHVVMFLYYANSEKTKIVVIEQGGNEPGINTVSTSIYSLSYYQQNGYIPRRLAEWS